MLMNTEWPRISRQRTLTVWSLSLTSAVSPRPKVTLLMSARGRFFELEMPFTVNCPTRAVSWLMGDFVVELVRWACRPGRRELGKKGSFPNWGSSRKTDWGTLTAATAVLVLFATWAGALVGVWAKLPERIPETSRTRKIPPAQRRMQPKVRIMARQGGR